MPLTHPFVGLNFKTFSTPSVHLIHMYYLCMDK
jgi:hypothetical protein